MPLRRELQLVGQPRLAEAGIAGNADDPSLRGRGAKGLPQRLELLVSSREGSELLVCLVDRGRARAAPDDAQRVDGALVDRHRLCLLKIEVPTQVGRGRGTHQHISGRRPVQTSCEHGRVTGGGVVHPKVVADAPTTTEPELIPIRTSISDRSFTASAASAARRA